MTVFIFRNKYLAKKYTDKVCEYLKSHDFISLSVMEELSHSYNGTLTGKLPVFYGPELVFYPPLDVHLIYCDAALYHQVCFTSGYEYYDISYVPKYRYYNPAPEFR